MGSKIYPMFLKLMFLVEVQIMKWNSLVRRIITCAVAAATIATAAPAYAYAAED